MLLSEHLFIHSLPHSPLTTRSRNMSKTYTMHQAAQAASLTSFFFVKKKKHFSGQCGWSQSKRSQNCKHFFSFSQSYISLFSGFVTELCRVMKYRIGLGSGRMRQSKRRRRYTSFLNKERQKMMMGRDRTYEGPWYVTENVREEVIDTYICIYRL